MSERLSTIVGVMGRKGIGKLAPFGICHEVEVISAGGEETDRGYVVSNLILDLDKILDEKFDDNGNVLPYHPLPGQQDGSYADSTGTTLILRALTGGEFLRGRNWIVN